MEMIKGVLLGKEKVTLLEKLQNKFLNPEIELLGDTPIFSEGFIKPVDVIDFKDVETLDILKNVEDVFLYLEREDEVYATTIKDVLNYFKSFEDWEETDAFFFSMEMTWLVEITHEDMKTIVRRV